MSSAHDAVGVTAGPVARGSVARVGIATAIAAVCGYGVMYLAARRPQYVNVVPLRYLIPSRQAPPVLKA